MIMETLATLDSGPTPIRQPDQRTLTVIGNAYGLSTLADPASVAGLGLQRAIADTVAHLRAAY